MSDSRPSFWTFVNENIERAICIVAVSVMTVAMTWQVLARFVLNVPAPVTDEISIYCVVWLTYFGASLAVTQRQHIRITILSELLPPKGKKALDIIANLATFGFMIFLTVGAYYMCEIAWKDHHTASTMPYIPMWAVLAGLPLSFALTCVRLVQDTLRHFREFAELSAPSKGA